MKKGENPERGKSQKSVATVRVFVVAYVPEFSGFFSDMETILKLSLDSLERSLDPTLGRVTLISNQSCAEVADILLARKGDVFDQVILNKTNRGKIDGLLTAARGAVEDVVVFSDCDVLFRVGWIEEILKVFSTFPECASVSPISSPRRYFYETRTTIVDAALKRELSVKKRMPLEDFERMTEGSDNPEVQLRFLNGQATVSRAGYDTGLSGGHQCVAFRREMLAHLPTKPCFALLEPHADRDYLDRPPDVNGYWRLSTPRNFAFHMGNRPSPWMYELNNGASERVPLSLPLPALRKPLVGHLPYVVRRKIAQLINLRFSRKLVGN